MFGETPVGREHPLERKQLKWLLIVLGVVLALAVLWYISMQNRMDDDAALQGDAAKTMTEKSAAPTREEIQAQLDMLAKEDAANPAPKPTQEEIQAQLDMLVKEDAANPAPKPTQEEIQAQLDALSKQ